MHSTIDGIAEMLACRWPGKFSDEEITDLVPRLERYHIHDVESALEQHKNRSKFKPQWAELLALLNVITRSNAAAVPNKPIVEKTFPEMLAAQLQTLPAAAVLKYWRREWERYATDAVERRNGVPPGDTLQLMLRQYAGKRAQVLRGVISGLISAGADSTWAAGIAEVITAEPIEFIYALNAVESGTNWEPAPSPATHRVPQSIFGEVFRPIPPLRDGKEKDRHLSMVLSEAAKDPSTDQKRFAARRQKSVQPHKAG